ncbi:hypothetical protein FRC02_005681 [Tulasnella sp. 418]|nr:hypothetical protein FRC02_005681 [Tulasnella sp. 418]
MVSRLTLALAAYLCFITVSTSSVPPRPLKRVHNPSNVGLYILPRSNPSLHSAKRSLNDADPLLRHTDSLRLSFSVDDTHVNLHLSPNNLLIHPAARVNYYSQGKISRTEPLLPHSYRVYHGAVVHPDDTVKRIQEDVAGGLVHGSSVREIGWASIMVHDQGDPTLDIPPTFEGAFSVGGVVHHIQTKENYLRNKHHLDPHVPVSASSQVNELGHLVIFKDSDIDDSHEQVSSCSHNSLDFNVDRHHPVNKMGQRQPSSPWYEARSASFDPLDLDSGLVKRQGDLAGNITTNFIDKIGSTDGCQKTQSIVYMGVAADCEYVNHYGSPSDATSVILNNWNTASGLYKKTFNVSLGIVQLAVQEPECPTANPNPPWNTPCTSPATLNDRLSLFSQWRGDKGASDGAGLWHLMSGCPTGTEVGVAWLGQLCTTEALGRTGEIVSGTGVSTATRTEWQVVAHEVGHNFGAIHDCSAGCTLTSDCCPASTSQCDANSGFIMSAVSNAGENTFSQCSIGNICTAMITMDTTCLQPVDPTKQTISLQMCGNGIVEPGEDCDPGVGTNSTCCDAATCKFTANAKCDPRSSDCCTELCQFAPSTRVCRQSRDSRCDKQEMCSGTSSSCPTDQTQPNGTPCGANGLACANGACTSLDEQCKTVGASLGLSKACPQNNDRSCQVSCQDPKNPNTCALLQAALIDGSPCGYGGTCQGAVCISGSALDTFKAWYRQNLQIAIPVTIVVGIVILLLLWGLGKSIMRCCCGAGRKRRSASTPTTRRGADGRQRLSSWVQGVNNSGTTDVNMRNVQTYPPPAFQPPIEYPPVRAAPGGYTPPGALYPPTHSHNSSDEDGQVGNRWQTTDRSDEILSPTSVYDDQRRASGRDAYSTSRHQHQNSSDYPVYSNPFETEDSYGGRERSGSRDVGLGRNPTGRSNSSHWVDDRDYNGPRTYGSR